MSVTVTSHKHIATAQVGMDSIENAEYLTFEHTISERPKRKMTLKDKLENLWWAMTRPFRKVKWKVEDVYWKVRYGFERMFKGYDSVDCFETFSKFIERYSKILIEYKKTHHGYPCDMSNQKWEDIIDEMIYHLYYMDEDNIEKELCKNVPDGWTPSVKTVDEIMVRHKDEFFKLFSEHFYNLWD
jgi:hypothetical protein